MPPPVSPAIAALEQEVKSDKVPKHVAIIMDGNGRWAEGQGKNRVEGHREGSNSVRDITRCARRVGLQALTLYAFSSQNWARPPFEVTALMDLLREYLIKERDELMDNDIKLNAIGELSRLPGHVREPLEALRRETAKNKSMVLTLALSYGGREELLHAAKELAKKVKSGALDPEKISEEELDKALWTNGLPAVDLMIRTSGEQRISNYLLWQLAYAELMFVDTAWPDFRDQKFLECLRSFQSRERRFGLTGAQVKGKAKSA
ncbi:MAG: isoprenyl transferase [Myxococcaceae bacterium]